MAAPSSAHTIPSHSATTAPISHPSIACGPFILASKMGIVMKGPTPIISSILAEVAPSRPIPRVSREESFIDGVFPSKQQFQSKLHLPHGGVRRKSRNCPKCGRSKTRPWLAIIRMIGQVKHLASHLQFESLTETEILEERQIQIRITRTTNRAPSGVAVPERVDRRCDKCSYVEILRQGTLVGSQRCRCHLVGPACATGIHGGTDQVRRQRGSRRQPGTEGVNAVHLPAAQHRIQQSVHRTKVFAPLPKWELEQGTDCGQMTEIRIGRAPRHRFPIM